MFRRRRDPRMVAEAIERQKELVVCISRITEETEESVAEVAELLRTGVDASANDYNLALYYASQNYFSPLHYAARKGAFKTIQLLLQHKADPNAKDRYEVTPLHLAAEHGSAQCVRLLINKGANINARTRYETQCHFKDRTAVLHGHGPGAAPFLAPPPQIPTSLRLLPYTGGTTPLHLAAQKDHVACVHRLITEGADYNAVNSQGLTSLYIAASKGNPECVLTQLRSASSVPILAIPDSSDDTALHCCLRNGEKMKECVRELVHHGSDVSFVNKSGETPIHIAIRNHWDMDTIRLMLWKGYNMDLDRGGKSLLDLMVFGESGRLEVQVERNEEMAALFIKMGASRNLENILCHELRSGAPSSCVLRTAMEAYAHLPSLDRVMARESELYRYERQQNVIDFRHLIAYPYDVYHTHRTAKKEEYKARAQRVPTLQHLSRCHIRKVMGPRLRCATRLPIPQHLKEFVLLDLPIPRDL